ncbi:hypothetical protein F4Z98_17820 [Candidatus Poribacteria bacterium]|nr:hypothetical protein [Candidatus Poribacteria bacterium]MYC39944.1 hypothetical protein [Candidatus Dadabacteria bacterium]
MFVLTEDCEILNLAQCIKIVVEGNRINAYAPMSGYPRSTNLIACFDTEVEAGYAYFELFKSLKAGKRTWDPYAIKPLSTVWDKIDKHFDNSDVPCGLTDRAQISAFRLDQVTITYESEVNRRFGKEAIAGYQKRVVRKLRELLGDTMIEVEWTS